MGNKSAKGGKRKSEEGRTLCGPCNGVEIGEEGHKSQTDVPFDRYCFPFDNIVFEGGGSKALAYCGAVRVLEDVGIWKQVLRLAGSSSGAIMAALLAVGYKSHDLQTFFSKDLKKLFIDQSRGCCGGLLPGLRKRYGWHSGKKLDKWIGNKLKEATGNADITFMEIYKKYNKEVCIVVTNMNRMMVEYCHPKTTPDMPVRLAANMSMATPGFFQPVKYQRFRSNDYYVEGGPLCNFPIHSFDGWYLSMKPEDNFLRRLHPIKGLPRDFQKSERFANHNERTLGFMLFSEIEPDFMQTILEKRDGSTLPEKMPDTKLSKARVPKLSANREMAQQYEDMSEVVERLVKVLRSRDLDTSHSISRDDFQRAISESPLFTKEDFKVLFGPTTSVNEIFHYARKRSNKTEKKPDDQLKISYSDLISFLETKDIYLQSHFMGCRRKDITSLKDYTQSLQDAVLLNTRNIDVEKRDLERIVGINTYYIGSMDYDMEKADKQFLISQGEQATRAFLLYHLMNMVPPLKGDWRKSFARDDIKIFVDDDSTEIIDAREYDETFNIRYDV